MEGGFHIVIQPKYHRSYERSLCLVEYGSIISSRLCEGITWGIYCSCNDRSVKSYINGVVKQAADALTRLHLKARVALDWGNALVTFGLVFFAYRNFYLFGGLFQISMLLR